MDTTRAAPGPAPYRREDGVVVIDIRLHTLAQLYTSFDPAPFRERDLDPAAEAYVVEALAEFSARLPAKLVIHLPAAELPGVDAADIARSFGHYFDYRLGAIDRERRTLLHNGWLSLAIGLAFLFACIAAREAVSRMAPAPVAPILAEGLLIMGWVAMWRPLQVFLYDWWPLRRRGALFRRARDLPVELRGYS